MLRPIEGTAREYEYRRLAVLGDLVGGRLPRPSVCAGRGLTQYTTPGPVLRQHPHAAPRRYLPAPT